MAANQSSIVFYTLKIAFKRNVIFNYNNINSIQSKTVKEFKSIT